MVISETERKYSDFKCPECDAYYFDDTIFDDEEYNEIDTYECKCGHILTIERKVFINYKVK